MHGVQPKRKGKPHQIGAPKPTGLATCEAFLPHQPRNRREPEKMQAHDDDDDAGNDREFARIGAQHGADGAGAGAERDEHGGEAEHEQKRRNEYRLAARAVRLGVGQAFKRVPVR